MEKTLKSIVVVFASSLKIRFGEEDRNLAYVHVHVNPTNIVYFEWPNFLAKKI